MYTLTVGRCINQNAEMRQRYLYLLTHGYQSRVWVPSNRPLCDLYFSLHRLLRGYKRISFQKFSVDNTP